MFMLRKSKKNWRIRHLPVRQVVEHLVPKHRWYFAYFYKVVPEQMLVQQLSFVRSPFNKKALLIYTFGGVLLMKKWWSVNVIRPFSVTLCFMELKNKEKKKIF